MQAIIQLLHLNKIKRLVQYCCTLLHETSYWSRSSAVIVLLHTALFYSNFEIWWKLWNFDTFWKFYHFEFFWNLMKFLKVFKFYENFDFFFKKNEILRNFWNFKINRNCFLLINMLENGMSRVLLLANRKTVK